ncbi:MAG: DUF421 domain-containing protein [Clostridiales bacterium]|nr:DUF421 domain-containing protein [Clostridiales bacterium]
MKSNIKCKKLQTFRRKNMITIFIRAILLYIMMIFAIRLMGKKQLGQFEPYELAMALLIADILATPMSDVSTPLFHGVLPVMAMIGIHALVTILSLKSDKARALISGKPSLIISNGIIDFNELSRLSLSISDLLEGIREFGILNPWDVECAIMEANGTITAFEKSKKRAPTAEELEMYVENEVFPAALIMDGKIQKSSVILCALSEKRLTEALEEINLSAKEILLATIDRENRINLQTKSGLIRKIHLGKE